MFLIEFFQIIKEFLEEIYPGLNKNFYNQDNLDYE